MTEPTASSSTTESNKKIKSESITPQLNSEARTLIKRELTNMSTKSNIKLKLPEDAQSVKRELLIFDLLAAKEGMSDEAKVIKLHNALRESSHYERCREVIDVSHLSSYQTLKDEILKLIELDIDQEYQMIFNPTNRNPIQIYNKVKQLNPTYTDNEILPFLKMHLPTSVYLQYTSMNFQDSSLRDHLINYMNLNRGVQSTQSDYDLSKFTANNQINLEMMKLIQTQSELLANLKKETAPPSHQANVNEIQASEANQPSEINELTTAIKQLINNVNANGNRTAVQRDQCSFHFKYRSNARSCRPPCRFYDPTKFTVPGGRGTFKIPQNPSSNFIPPPSYSQPSYAPQQFAATNQLPQQQNSQNQPNSSNINAQQFLEFVGFMSQFARRPTESSNNLNNNGH